MTYHQLHNNSFTPQGHAITPKIKENQETPIARQKD